METILRESLIQKYNLSLGTYYFYEEYFIGEIKEGAVISLDNIGDLPSVVTKHFGNEQPFTYISNRIHSHSIKPTHYLECPFIYMPNFKGYGVITYNSVSEKSTEVEKHFAVKPFYNFKKLEDAIAWAKKEAIK